MSGETSTSDQIYHPLGIAAQRVFAMQPQGNEAIPIFVPALANHVVVQ